MSTPEPEVTPDPEDGNVLSEIQDPLKGSLSEDEFALRVAAKIEEAQQDRGILVPPGHPDDPTPLEPLPETEPVAPPEPEPEGEPEGPEEPGEEGDFFVGRYRDKDAAESGLREKDETINRLYRELNEQRQQVEDAVRQRSEEGPEQIDAPAWAEWAETAVANGDGADGALAALRTGGMDGYDLYLRFWLDDDEQRADALAFNNRVMLELSEQRARAVVQPMISDRNAALVRSEAEVAKQYVNARYADFGEYQEEMDRLVEQEGVLDEQTKVWLAQTASSGFEGKMRAWEYLYLTAVRTKAPGKAQARNTEGKRRRSSADAAKVAATVSTSEGAARTSPGSATEQEILSRRNELRKEWGLPLLEE